MEEKIIEEYCECEDIPVTYCKKCKRFYAVSKDGMCEEILIKVDELED